MQKLADTKKRVGTMDVTVVPDLHTAVQVTVGDLAERERPRGPPPPNDNKQTPYHSMV